MTHAAPDIRIYSPYFPFPVTEGAFQVILDQARLLAERWTVELVTWKDEPAEIARKLAAEAALPFPPSVRVTSFHGGAITTGSPAVWRSRGRAAASAPEPASARVRRVARSLVSGWASPELFYYPHERDLRAGLPPARLGIYHYSFAYSWLRRSGAPAEASTVVHLHNLESRLSLLRSRRDAGLDALVHRLNASKLDRHERRLGGLADELWFVSGRDLRLRRADGPTPHRLVAPTFDPRLRQLRQAQFRARLASDPSPSLRLGFIGSCSFEPNRASLRWIVDELAPALRSAGFQGRIQVVGRGVPRAIREAAEPYGFFDWMGFVPELDGFWSGLSFLLVPEIGGSGVRIKLLEALASGVPVLANHAATEALSPTAQADPLLSVLEHAGHWAARIVAEGPMESRSRLADSEAWGGREEGEATYDFLSALLGDPVTAPAPSRTARPPSDEPRILR